MKKPIKSAFFLACLACAGGWAVSAHAATLPPGNPFYFVQDGMRSLRRAFTFNPAAKAALEIKLVSERRADLHKVVAAQQADGIIIAALDAYAAEAEALRGAFSAIKDEKMFGGIAEAYVRDYPLLGGIAGRGEGAAAVEVRDAAERARAALTDAMLLAAERGDMAAMRAGARAATARDAAGYGDVYEAEAWSALARAAEEPRIAAVALRLRDDALASIIGKIKKGTLTLEAIPNASGDPIMRFEILEEARTRVSDVETKNALLFAREQALDAAKDRGLVTAHAVRAMLASARRFAAAGGNDQAVYALDQAERLYADAAYDMALQYAANARIAAAHGFVAAHMDARALQEEIAEIKRRFDSVRTKPAFIERRIVALADTAHRLSAREAWAQIRDLKLVLALLPD